MIAGGMEERSLGAKQADHKKHNIPTFFESIPTLFQEALQYFLVAIPTVLLFIESFARQSVFRYKNMGAKGLLQPKRLPSTILGQGELCDTVCTLTFRSYMTALPSNQVL